MCNVAPFTRSLGVQAQSSFISLALRAWICDTKLPDGAMELLRLAGGMARGPIGPAGESARSG
jgi:hypothetical protein